MPRYLLVSSAASAVDRRRPGRARHGREHLHRDHHAGPRPSTANSGNPDNITITSTGSVKPASGTAVTQNTNHSVTNQGTIQISNSNGAVGIGATAGVTGDILNSKDDHDRRALHADRYRQ